MPDSQRGRRATAYLVLQCNTMALTSGSRGNLAYVIFELKFVYPKPRTEYLAAAPSHLLPFCFYLLAYLYFVAVRFVSFRFALFVCLFICWLIRPFSIIHNHFWVGGGEVGQSSHCVKFFASTSFGILCQGHWTNSLDLTSMENICTLICWQFPQHTAPMRHAHHPAEI